MRAHLMLLLVTGASWAGDPGNARELSRNASELYAAARYTEAEPLYRKAVEAWAQAGPESARDGAIDKRNLGAVLRVMGRFAEAEPLLLESVTELEATGASGIERWRALDNLAALYRIQGSLSKAEEFASNAVALSEKLADGTPAERLGPRVILASIYIEQHRFGEADTVLRAGLASADGALAVVTYDDLAIIALSRGDFVQAEEMARRALHFAELALPGENPAVAASWNTLGQACRFRGDYPEAERAYRQAIAIWEKSVGPSHPNLAKGLMNLAMLYHERGRETGAESLYRRASAILEQSFGADDPQPLLARNQLAEILRAEHRYSESKRLSLSTLAALEKALPPDDVRLARARSNYARLLRESGSR
jgi:tetratricopeptide (TPR) repeat protein